MGRGGISNAECRIPNEEGRGMGGRGKVEVGGGGDVVGRGAWGGDCDQDSGRIVRAVTADVGVSGGGCGETRAGEGEGEENSVSERELGGSACAVAAGGAGDACTKAE